MDIETRREKIRQAKKCLFWAVRALHGAFTDNERTGDVSSVGAGPRPGENSK
jgi:hypothetical protein